MALVRIEIRAGKPAEYRQAILDGIHRALVASLGITEHDVFQRLYELDAEHLICPPGSTDGVTLIEIVLQRGYAVEAKEHLYRNLVTYLGASPGIGHADIRIVLHDPPLQNWGIRGSAAPDLPAADA